MFNEASIWSLVLTMCIIALFVEGAALLRILFLTRQTLSRYLLLLIPLFASIWALLVLLSAINVFVTVPSYLGIHLNYAVYQMLKHMIDLATVACQVQSAISLVVFLVLLAIERKTLPHVERPPIWLLVKDQHMWGKEELWRGMVSKTRTHVPFNTD